jgi:hypothetical protein
MAGVSRSAAFFTPADIEPLGCAAGLPIVANDRDELASRLDNAAIDYVLWARSENCAPPGEIAEWLAIVQARAEKLLEAFELGFFAGSLKARAHSIMVRELPHDPDAELCVLLSRLGEHGANAPSEKTLNRAMDGVRMLRRLAVLNREAYMARKGGKRRASPAELALMKELVAVYRTMFGRKPGYTNETDTSAQPGATHGPFPRFCAEVFRRIRDRHTPEPGEDVRETERDTMLLERLNELAESPSRIITRYRDVKSGGPVRKR